MNIVNQFGTDDFMKKVANIKEPCKTAKKTLITFGKTFYDNALKSKSKSAIAKQKKNEDAK
jgi:hypothetical protein